MINDQFEIRIHPLLVLQETLEAAQQEIQRIAVETLPPAEGWEEHQVVVQEIEQGLLFDDGHRLTWQVEQTEQNTEAANGES
jgi:hypothetical protein